METPISVDKNVGDCVTEDIAYPPLPSLVHASMRAAVVVVPETISHEESL